jgi:hypothetical protein
VSPTEDTTQTVHTDTNIDLTIDPIIQTSNTQDEDEQTTTTVDPTEDTTQSVHTDTNIDVPIDPIIQTSITHDEDDQTTTVFPTEDTTQTVHTDTNIDLPIDPSSCSFLEMSIATKPPDLANLNLH